MLLCPLPTLLIGHCWVWLLSNGISVCTGYGTRRVCSQNHKIILKVKMRFWQILINWAVCRQESFFGCQCCKNVTTSAANIKIVESVGSMLQGGIIASHLPVFLHICHLHYLTWVVSLHLCVYKHVLCFLSFCWSLKIRIWILKSQWGYFS